MGRTVKQKQLPSRVRKQLPYRFGTIPFSHQLEAWKRSKDLEAFALLMEMGTGKTKILIDTAAYLYDKGKIDSAIVFTTKGSYLNWVDKEVPEHIPKHIQYRAVAWNNSSSKKAQREMASVMEPDESELLIFVMNIEALAHARSYEFAQRFVVAHTAMMVIDESTMIKNPKAKRTKAAVQLGRFTPYRRISTGMPVTNSPLDVYAQCRFLGRRYLGFSSYYSFRAQYATMIDMSLPNRPSFKKVTGYQNLDELTDKLKKFSFIVSKEDCIDLPPKVYERYAVELTPQQMKLYKQLKEEALAELGGLDIITAPLVITRMLRMHQLVCGHLPDERGRVHEIENNRLTALDDVLSELSGQIVIWATYRFCIQKIRQHLIDRYGAPAIVTYYGDTKRKERQEAITKFQSGKAKFFIGNPQTAGHGLTLTASSYHIYYSNNFSLEMRAQSEDRSHRIGQDKSVTYIDLYAPGTVDEKILKALATKRDLADMVMNWRELF
jgi:SNF2 family DNA or RNA helicase